MMTIILLLCATAHTGIVSHHSVFGLAVGKRLVTEGTYCHEGLR